MEGSAAVRILGRPEAAPMCFNERARNRQAHANVIGLGTKKWIEHFGKGFERKTWTAVGYRNLDLMFACQTRTDR